MGTGGKGAGGGAAGGGGGLTREQTTGRAAEEERRARLATRAARVAEANSPAGAVEALGLINEAAREVRGYDGRPALKAVGGRFVATQVEAGALTRAMEGQRGGREFANQMQRSATRMLSMQRRRLSVRGGKARLTVNMVNATQNPLKLYTRGRILMQAGVGTTDHALGRIFMNKAALVMARRGR